MPLARTYRRDRSHFWPTAVPVHRTLIVHERAQAREEQGRVGFSEASFAAPAGDMCSPKGHAELRKDILHRDGFRLGRPVGTPDPLLRFE